MKVAAVAALIWAAASPALAAPVTVGMTFFNASGEAVGSGSFAYDPDVTADIYFDGAQLCSPAPLDPACTLAATWTPITSFQWSVYGATFASPAPLFLEGYIEPPGGGERAGLVPGGWFIGDPATGEALAIGPLDFSSASSWSLNSFQLFDLDPSRFPNADAQGSLEFTPAEVPAPAAAILFLSGLAGAASIRKLKRRRSPDR